MHAVLLKAAIADAFAEIPADTLVKDGDRLIEVLSQAIAIVVAMQALTSKKPPDIERLGTLVVSTIATSAITYSEAAVNSLAAKHAPTSATVQ